MTSESLQNHKHSGLTRLHLLPLLLVLVAAMTLAPPAWSAESQPDVQQAMEQLLRSDNLAIGGTRILAEETVLEIYQGHGFNPFWTDKKNIQELLELIEEAPNHGLDPVDYSIDQVRQILSRQTGKSSAREVAEAEILLTESLLRYGYHRRFGKVTANKLDPDINFRRDAFKDQPPYLTFREILGAPSMQAFIDMAAPSGPIYQQLQYWLHHYRELAAVGGWQPVPEGPTLRLDDSGSRVNAIRARLLVTGELPANAGRNSALFDRQLKQAVQVFQSHHSLDADGIVGKQTIAAMNVPVEQRINQLRVSLERLRWVNQEAVDTLVAVNIAGFEAFFFKAGELAWSTRAMVGKSYRQTPVFSGDIAYLEFNPTWTIPPGILRNDTLPAIKRDPNYLASKNIRVIDRNGKFVNPATVDWNKYSKGVPYTLRQDPGPKNSLGTVKFIFPNKHFVFLHDTPHRELFDRPERAFSSGCIRVEDPLRLGELLLDDQEKYSKSDLKAIVDSRKTQRINLADKVPVVILYLTASIAADNNVRFLKDIYDRDQKVLDALNGPVVIDLPDTVQN